MWRYLVLFCVLCGTANVWGAGKAPDSADCIIALTDFSRWDGSGFARGYALPSASSGESLVLAVFQTRTRAAGVISVGILQYESSKVDVQNKIPPAARVLHYYDVPARGLLDANWAFGPPTFPGQKDSTPYLILRLRSQAGQDVLVLFDPLRGGPSASRLTPPDLHRLRHGVVRGLMRYETADGVDVILQLPAAPGTGGGLS